MNILQIEEPGRVTWREVDRPTPRPGEVLVKVSAVTTCTNWDLHIMSGRPMFADRPLSYPYVPGEPGHEAVGEIVAGGRGVEGLLPGMRVVVWRDPGDRRQGCYAEYVAVRAEDVLPAPPELPDEALASMELGMCVHVSFDQLLARDGVRGRRVGISGLGASGLIAVQMAKAYGAAEVVGIDPMAKRRALALELGADRVLSPDDVDAFPPERFHESSLASAIDTTGLKSSIEFLLERTNETVAIFGVLREFVGFGPDHWWGGFALLGYGRHNRGAAERALALVRAGSLLLQPLVTHILPVTEYEAGIELLRRREAIKVLFTIQES